MKVRLTVDIQRGEKKGAAKVGDPQFVGSFELPFQVPVELWVTILSSLLLKKFLERESMGRVRKGEREREFSSRLYI